MPVRKEELERAMEVIVDAAMEIETQDNLATANSIFQVQEERRIYGIDCDECDDCEGWDWYDKSEGESYEEGTEGYETAQECLDENGYHPEEWERIGYITYWHNLQPFFTRKAAERYIRENRHNMTLPRIYVESAYRNREWIAIRTMLKSMYEKAGE